MGCMDGLIIVSAISCMKAVFTNKILITATIVIAVGIWWNHLHSA